MSNPNIRKADGELQQFQPEKIKRFLKMIRVPAEFLDEVARCTRDKCQEGMSTQELMQITNEELGKIPHGRVYQARYTLKDALRKLGPAGHNFEEYIGQMFRLQDYNVEVGTVMQGKCVTHEIDVAASNSQELNLVECKFHNQEGTRSDITVAMYSYARFQDVYAHQVQDREEYGWLATNTKLTKQALDYSECMGVKVLNFYYPRGTAIFDFALDEAHFPVTSLVEIESEFPKLLKAGIYTVRDFVTQFQSRGSDSSPFGVYQAGVVEVAEQILNFRDKD